MLYTDGGEASSEVDYTERWCDFSTVDIVAAGTAEILKKMSIQNEV